MISKVISPGKSFTGLCRYLFQNKDGAEVILSAGVRDYDHAKMAADFTIQAAQNPRLKSPVLHMILSWPPHEQISTDLMTVIASDFLEKMHISDTQVAVIKHSDRDHQHLHIVVNRVNNNGATIKDNYIGLRGKKTAQELTQKYGLTPAIGKDLAHTNIARLHGYDAQRYEVFSIIHDLLPKSRGFEELQRHLSVHEIEIVYKYKGQTNEVQGISFCKGDFRFKGSEIDRSFSYKNLEKLFASKRQQQSINKTSSSKAKSLQSEYKENASQAARLLYDLLKPEHNPDFVPHEFERKKRRKSLGL